MNIILNTIFKYMILCTIFNITLILQQKILVSVWLLKMHAITVITITEEIQFSAILSLIVGQWFNKPRWLLKMVIYII